MGKTNHVTQTAYEQSRYDDIRGPVEERISVAMFRYLTEDLGLPESIARRRSDQEVNGHMFRTICDEVAGMGVIFAGRTFVELGAGLGGVTLELSRRGASVIAVEPGSAWRAMSQERLRGQSGVQVIGAFGEYLPIASNSIDTVVSLQVLEHVQDPDAVIREVFRVLKPGGAFFASYENYLSFYEPHYRVAWFPLLPKPLGALYLQLRGRSPRFLRESITYTTYFGVRRSMFNAGFECSQRRTMAAGLASPGKASLKWKLLKWLARASPGFAAGVMNTVMGLRRGFRTAVTEFMIKPENTE